MKPRRSLSLLLIPTLLALAVLIPHSPSRASAPQLALLSVNSNGETGDGWSSVVALSSDGRFALLRSNSDNFSTAQTTNGQLFRRDLWAGETTPVVTLTSPPAGDFVLGDTGDMSADGNSVALIEGDTYPDYPNDTYPDLFIWDGGLDTLTRLTAADGAQFDAGVGGREVSPRLRISADGNVILFVSFSTNILPGHRWSEDLYLFDRTSQTYSRVTERATSGGLDRIDSFVLSADGRTIAFVSADTSFIPGLQPDGLLRTYVYDRLTASYEAITPGVALKEDRNDAVNAISGDGRYVVLSSTIPNLEPGETRQGMQVYVYDRETDTFKCVSVNGNGDTANADSYGAALSDDGQIVAFASKGDNLLPGTPPDGLVRVYLLNRVTDELIRLDNGLDGQPSNADAGFPLLLTPNGRFVGFSSRASNLVPNDTNRQGDAFFYDRDPSAQDGDGVDEAVEAGAPNGGDGNYDGLPDSRQPNVASLLNTGDGDYITLAAPYGTALTGVLAIQNPNEATSPPWADFFAGFLQFAITGLGDGATTLELILADNMQPNTYYKYGPTADNQADHWYQFAYDGTTGAEVLPGKVVLHFVDGRRGDSDLAVNGVITDPGGLSIDPLPDPPAVHLSPVASVTLAGMTYADEDILAFDEAASTWSLFFDGSDVGLTKVDVSAFELLDDGDILLSLDRPLKSLPGLPNITADDSDILRFTPASTGTTTAGTFTIWFDGSDAGLTTLTEKIDAIAFAPNGDLVLSTVGAAAVPSSPRPLKVADEDLLAFHATSTGPTTAGSWRVYFDTGDVSAMLSDIVAADINPATGDIFFAVDKKWVFGALAINTFDVARCAGPATGAASACAAVERFWLGAEHGFGVATYKIDGFDMD